MTTPSHQRSLALALALSSGAVFFVLSFIRLAWPTFDGAASFLLRADGIRFFNASDWLGMVFDPLLLLSATFIGVAILFYIEKRAWAFFFFFAMSGALLSGLALKEFFEIARPSQWGPVELGWSFPSLHATTATVLFLSFLYVLEERVHTHALVLFWGIILIASVAMAGLSRVYLGVHVFSDVLAGFALGVFWVSISVSATSRFRRAR